MNIDVDLSLTIPSVYRDTYYLFEEDRRLKNLSKNSSLYRILSIAEENLRIIRTEWPNDPKSTKKNCWREFKQCLDDAGKEVKDVILRFPEKNKILDDEEIVKKVISELSPREQKILFSNLFYNQKGKIDCELGVIINEEKPLDKVEKLIVIDIAFNRRKLDEILRGNLSQFQEFVRSKDMARYGKNRWKVICEFIYEDNYQKISYTIDLLAIGDFSPDFSMLDAVCFDVSR